MWRKKKTVVKNTNGSMKGHLFFMLFALGLLAIACNLTDGGQPTPPPVTDQASIPDQLPSPQVLPTVVTGQAPTAETTFGVTTVPSTASPTITPSATSTLPPTQVPSPEVQSTPAGVEMFQPGQSDTADLAAGESRLYPFQGISFEPLLFFAEGDADLDLVLAVYEGLLTQGELTTEAPVGEADLNPAGRPELLVFTPEEDGPYTVIIQARDDNDGQFTLYLYDSTTATAGAQLFSGSLAAGQTVAYQAQSNGGRPVIVFADPVNQENLVIEVSEETGQVTSTADYGGGGSAEALYLLPLRTTSYTITIREVGSAAATFNLVIIALS